MKYIVNGRGDLAMSHKSWVGEEVSLVKVCKSGLYLISDENGRQTSVPKRNLDIIE